MSSPRLSLPLVALLLLLPWPAPADELEPIAYNHPGLTVKLGAGLWAWPVPIDFDEDGDLDLVVVCPDKPSNGAWLFENVEGKVKLPVFKAGKRISQGLSNVSPSYVDGGVRILSPAREHPQFRSVGLGQPAKLPLAENIHPNKVRANVWKYVDFDGDGALDLVVGVEDWTEYGWDNAYDASGRWTNGPLHGYVYLLRNSGTTSAPKYDEPRKLEADGKPIDTFGMPSPNFADFDGDGDLDLVCGEFLDGFTYFQNTGTRTAPQYAAGVRLSHDGQPLAMDVQMIVPVAIDWDGDGDQDLIVGDEDGGVALMEHTGKIDEGVPQFLPPVYFQQQAADVKCGALATPVTIDWDADGDLDIVCGNTAGRVLLFKNESGPGVERPSWSAPQEILAQGKPIHIQAGPNGSIQGPCEAKWGYTTPTVADWDGDGLFDLVLNSIWGRVVWYRNTGTRQEPSFAAEQPVEVAWEGTPPKPAWNWWNPAPHELVTQWRTKPLVLDLNGDSRNDLVMLDHEGYLAFFERLGSEGDQRLKPGARIFVDEQGAPLHLNDKIAGKSGRRQLELVDWDGDGKLDLLVDGLNAAWYRQVEQRDGKYSFRSMGNLDKRPLAGHTTSPTTVDWNNDQVPDLLVGAEDGRLYYLRNQSRE
ncbi:MAG: VCBS repeat-containing protein [Pirellulales bacterium]|nr:VCBS repeat-containing protein [Pirellulales bacterium]